MKRTIVKDGIYKKLRWFVAEVKDNMHGVQMRKNTSMPRYWFCGYVEVPKESDLYLDLWADGFDVHGGITFTDFLPEDKRIWAMGFDGGHVGDDPNVQNANFMEEECKKLIDQILEVEI